MKKNQNHIEKHNLISAKKAVSISVIVDLVDIFANLFVALITNSIILYAEVMQGISDLIADFFVFIGIQRSKRKPSQRYPFGYGRELYVWTLFSSIVMFAGLATLSFYFGWKRFINPEPIDYLPFAYFVVLVSIITNGYSLSIGLRRLIYHEKSKNVLKAYFKTPLIETRSTVTSDIVGTLSGLFGLIALILYGITGDLKFDGIGAMSIGILMAFFSLLLLRNIKGFIIGKSAPSEVLEKIEKTTRSVPGVASVLDIRATYLGLEGLLIHINIHAQDNLITDQLENLIDNVEREIKKILPNAKYIQVELDNPKKLTARVKRY